jgi:hypothetical protein
MISALHTGAVVDDWSRCIGVTKKKPKCVADYNTHMHGVDTADQYLAYYPFIRKTIVMLYLQNPTLIPTNHS